jgi:hypothetical protein
MKKSRAELEDDLALFRVLMQEEIAHKLFEQKMAVVQDEKDERDIRAVTARQTMDGALFCIRNISRDPEEDLVNDTLTKEFKNKWEEDIEESIKIVARSEVSIRNMVDWNDEELWRLDESKREKDISTDLENEQKLILYNIEMANKKSITNLQRHQNIVCSKIDRGIDDETTKKLIENLEKHRLSVEKMNNI